MPTYLSRPVFDFEIEWATPSQSLAYDPKPIKLGFGALEYAPTHRHVQRGWRVKLWLHTAHEIAAFEEFTAGLKGRFLGCWLPEPAAVLTVLGSAAVGEIDIRACGLLDSWTAGPPLLLWLSDPSGSVAALGATVLAVTAPSAGVERVTISAAVSPGPGWMVQRLIYVRLGDDVEKATAVGEHREERELSFVELREEYAAIETGEEPIFLYHFLARPVGESPLIWRFTSAAATYTVDGDAYLPLPINHRRITRDDDPQDQTLEISTVMGESLPWWGYQVAEPERPLELTLSKVPYGTTTGAEILFMGELSDAQITGRQVTLTFGSWLDGASRVPSMLYGPGCHYDLYEPTTCGVDPTAYELPVTLDVIVGIRVTLGGAGLVAQPADWFSSGRLVTGTGSNQEVRGIIGSSAVGGGQVQVVLSRELLRAVITQAGTLRPGCDRRYPTCEGKFANGPRYPGFDHMPQKNPVLKGSDVAGNGGKK